MVDTTKAPAPANRSMSNSQKSTIGATLIPTTEKMELDKNFNYSNNSNHY